MMAIKKPGGETFHLKRKNDHRINVKPLQFHLVVGYSNKFDSTAKLPL
jgi:hypothetical protein